LQLTGLKSNILLGSSSAAKASKWKGLEKAPVSVLPELPGGVKVTARRLPFPGTALQRQSFEANLSLQTQQELSPNPQII
jgi:hypothetical protein